MTNEAAFEKWAIDYGLDYEPSFTRYDVEAAWQAAIAYMQEQNKSTEQSEPVTYLKFYSYESGLDRQEGFEEGSKHTEGAFPVFTAPQRQQPLKRLNYERLEILWMNVVDSLPECSPEMAFANAIMNAMQEINK